MVLMANALPMILYPKKIKGIFITMIKAKSGMEVRADIKSEMPVAPPSIK